MFFILKNYVSFLHMLLIIAIHSISVNCYNSIYVILCLPPTRNIYSDLIVVWAEG